MTKQLQTISRTFFGMRSPSEGTGTAETVQSFYQNGIFKVADLNFSKSIHRRESPYVNFLTISRKLFTGADFIKIYLSILNDLVPPIRNLKVSPI